MDDSFFSLFNTVFILIFLIFIGFMVYALINIVLNATAEAVTVKATIIGKDIDTHVNMNENGGHSTNTYTILFETEFSERLTLNVGRKFYHQLIVGDYGELVYKRKWFKSFDLIK